MRRAFLVVAVVSAAAAGAAAAAEAPIPLEPPTGYRDYCNGLPRPSVCPTGRAPQALWRRLALPSLAPGATCPVSPGRRIPGLAAPALGVGPVYFPAGAYNPPDRTTMEMAFPATSGPARGTGWGVGKSQLVMKKSLRIPLVVRGRRIDGVGEWLGFSHVATPYIALQFAPNSPAIPEGGWKAYGLLVWATTPGCYALQVDGPAFSRVIVFKVAFAATA